MKRFLSKCLVITACLFAVGSFQPVFSQTNVDTSLPEGDEPSVFDPNTADLPGTVEEYWTWGISLITPVIVWAFGKIPQLPRPVLPLLTPFVGIVLGLGMRALADLNLSWVDMAQAGTVAVFIRESVNQLVTKQMKPREASKTNAYPVDQARAVRPGQAAPIHSQPGHSTGEGTAL